MGTNNKGGEAFGNNRNKNVEAFQRCDTKGQREERQIRRDLQMENITLKARQVILCWCGHILRMDEDGNGGTLGKPRQGIRRMSNFRHDMNVCGLEEGDVHDG